MEFNKEEGRRAREIAIRRFLANDFAGARKFALKAQFLSPELDGIAQMVATFDVHLSAQNIIHGEIDHYGVLGINPEADDETVRKRYRKLAVLLHPDRNKSIGAEEAFKFLSQAWAMFSDKAKRADYDLKRNLGLYEGGRGASSSKPANNGSQKATKAKSAKRGVKRASDASDSASAATATTSAHKTTADGTFWTVCRTCTTQYEYHRVYLNQNLRCPNCRKPFRAVETDPPGSGSIRQTFHEHQLDSMRQMTDGREKSRDNNGVYGEHDSFEWGGVHTGTKNPGHAAQTGPRKDEVVRREYTKRVAGAPSTNPPKRRKVLENAVAGSNTASCSAPKSKIVKEFSEEELNNLLKMKAMRVISRKLQELSTIVAEADANGRQTDDLDVGNESCCVDSVEGTSAFTIDVPERDFCDLDKDRAEKSFADNQCIYQNMPMQI
ncbi:hypothetical protein EUTSA_v10000169mg [Eutrema salsugineum]|uniref:J domain-containing protein n=1 Tax=Eutrema salsugineum TaxID=72664 RepID=V4M308_EUTSA|nr:uncharacterized protein LOC18022216 [Eutrema salsugineum]XP_024014177.1 uncharacterized protein LOC18022216 [Eutrema salsugineum]ESQ46613.1 hypothetical protein EUTSA_v10000169mg [Eutrema salsugineum]